MKKIFLIALVFISTQGTFAQTHQCPKAIVVDSLKKSSRTVGEVVGTVLRKHPSLLKAEPQKQVQEYSNKWFTDPDEKSLTRFNSVLGDATKAAILSEQPDSVIKTKDSVILFYGWVRRTVSKEHYVKSLDQWIKNKERELERKNNPTWYAQPQYGPAQVPTSTYGYMPY